MTRKLAMGLAAVLAMMLTGCGGGGSGSPEGAAADVLSAIQSERFERMYRGFYPHHRDEMSVQQEAEKFTADSADNWWDRNREELSGTGDDSLDPGRKLEISNQNDYFGLSPEQRAALHAGWYGRAHRWDRFSDRMDDLRLVGLTENPGFEGSGRATVTYRNRYRDTLTVELRRFRGAWYVTGVSLEGNRTLPTRSES